MILQALTEYYHRKQDQLAPIGFEEKEIPFLIVIDQDGRFVQLTDTRIVAKETNSGLKCSSFLMGKGGVERSLMRRHTHCGITSVMYWDSQRWINLMRSPAKKMR